MGKNVAIVLSAGSGKRMNSDTKKQYLLIEGKPVVYYSLKAFQNSAVIDEIILVTSKEDMDFVGSEIVSKYGFSKVTKIVEGGKERYNSVYCGIKACKNLDGARHNACESSDGAGAGGGHLGDVSVAGHGRLGDVNVAGVGCLSGGDVDGRGRLGGCDFIFIHDGARPFINDEILNRAVDTLKKYGSAVVGMPVKDTIKIVGDDNIVKDTPNRKSVWQIQTPQCFRFDIALNAYERLIAEENSGELIKRGIQVTDDAMVVETFHDDSSEFNVHLVEGSYENIKITTPEDLKIAEVFLSMQ